MSATTQARAKVAALTRSREPNDPELLETRRELATANIAAAITRNLELAPPLTGAQKAQLILIIVGAK